MADLAVLLAEARGRIAARDARSAAILAVLEVDGRIRSRNARGPLILSPALSGGYAFQLTYFDAAGPVGHMMAGTAAEAARLLAEMEEGR